MKQYDLLVIGFGKAGKTLAATFGKEGKQVALIEQDPAMYGGTLLVRIKAKATKLQRQLVIQ